jgi:hypothetical protein
MIQWGPLLFRLHISILFRWTELESSMCSLQFYASWPGTKEAFSLLTSPYASACKERQPYSESSSLFSSRLELLCHTGDAFVLFCRTQKFVLWGAYGDGMGGGCQMIRPLNRFFTAPSPLNPSKKDEQGGHSLAFLTQFLFTCRILTQECSVLLRCHKRETPGRRVLVQKLA